MEKKQCQGVSNKVSQEHAKGFRELQKEVLATLGGFHKTKGTTAYFVKVFVITFLYIASESMQWIYGFNLCRAIVHGAAGGLIGMNIMHEANHGAASLNPKINHILGIVWSEMIGKSAIKWKFTHNVLHHIHTNAEADPDARQSPVLRAHPTDEPGIINKFQHLYIWPLFALQHFSQAFLKEPIYLCTETKHQHIVHGNTEDTGSNKKDSRANVTRPLPDATKKDRLASLFFKCLYYLRFVILPILYAPEYNTVLCICTSVAVGTLLPGPFFIVSHNFPGVKFYSKNTDDERISFMASQVETASNWGGWLGIQLTGGLNCKYFFYTLFSSVCVILYINSFIFSSRSNRTPSLSWN